MNFPVLYSFRRCPYAIRARMALCYAGCPVEIREVDLRKIPSSMRSLSPKGSVPVLQLDGRVIDESLDIIDWALDRADPEGWRDADDTGLAESLLHRCDTQFKPLLDRYKYADRHPEASTAEHRLRALAFVQMLDEVLARQTFIHGVKKGRSDVAIFPFIRQFAAVDRVWFDAASIPHLANWLDRFLESGLFTAVMPKIPLWQDGDAIRPSAVHYLGSEQGAPRA